MNPDCMDPAYWSGLQLQQYLSDAEGGSLCPRVLAEQLLRGAAWDSFQARLCVPDRCDVLWAQHKYSVMAREPELYRQLGRQIAERHWEMTDLWPQLSSILQQPPTAGRLKNALLHMWGYLSEDAKAGYSGDVNQLPFDQLLLRIRECTPRQADSYLWNSTALGELGAYV